VLVEIRNYHYRPQELSIYKKWAQVHAVPYLKQQLDLVGFWIDNGEPPEVLDEPLDQLGPANITWIIQWQDMDERNQRMQVVFGSLEWQKIFEKLPGGFEHYLRREARFSEAL
jgi:hypothetical protein